MGFSINGFQLNNPLKPKRQKFGFPALLLSIMVGLILIFFGIAYAATSQADSSWVKTDGEIIGVDSYRSDRSTMYTPIVGYEVDGQRYQVMSSLSSSGKPTIGEVRQVTYNPDNPDEARVDTGAFALLIIALTVIGGAIIAGGLFAFVRSLRRGRAIGDLVKSGHKTTGIVADVRQTSNRFYQVVVAATDLNGAVQNYTSDRLTGLSSLAMINFQTDHIPIDVYIDTANPANYYVDISDLPNLTPQRIADIIKSKASASNTWSPAQINVTPASSAPPAYATPPMQPVQQQVAPYSPASVSPQPVNQATPPASEPMPPTRQGATSERARMTIPTRPPQP